jgi:hypothetical protein
MKTVIQQTALIALACSAFSAVGNAQTPGTQANFTFAINVYTEVPGTFARNPDTGAFLIPKEPATENTWSVFDKNQFLIQDKYEYATKVVITKISNKEILLALKEEQVIPDIVGWTIKLVEVPNNEQTSGPYFYIVKNGESPIFIGDHFDFGADALPSATTETYTKTTQYKNNALGEPLSSTETQVGSSTGRQLLRVNVATSLWALEIQGVGKFTSVVKRVGTVYQDVSTGITIPITGSCVAQDSGTASVVDGSMSAAAATWVADLTTLYPEAAAGN